jgi:hypothetical protein
MPEASELLTKSSHALRQCPAAFYCSRDYQKERLEEHKCVRASQACRQAGPGSSRQPPHDPHNPGFDFASGLMGINFLENIPGKDTFDRLMDCFHLRVEVEDNFTGEASPVHIGEDSREVFEVFLDLAEFRSKLYLQG